MTSCRQNTWRSSPNQMTGSSGRRYGCGLYCSAWWETAHISAPMLLRYIQYHIRCFSRYNICIKISGTFLICIHVILICIWYIQLHSDYQLFIVHVMQNSVITQLGYDISSGGPWKIHCNDNLWKILDYLIRSFGDLSNFMIICKCFLFLKRSTIIALTTVYFWVLTNILINI